MTRETEFWRNTEHYHDSAEMFERNIGYDGENTSDPEEMLARNERTGLVHDYAGAGLGRPLDCGCGLAEDEQNALVMIRRKHMERGIWKPAPCLQNDGSD